MGRRKSTVINSDLITPPPPALLKAAFNSRSGTMRFGAVAFDKNGEILSIGWNGMPDDTDRAVAAKVEKVLKAEAERLGLDPKTVNLIPGKGFRKTVHAEGRALLNLVRQTGNVADLAKIDHVQIAAVLPNGKYFGIKKMDPQEKEVWATCRHCARAFELAHTHGEILTTNGWIPVNPRHAFESATTARKVPKNFWDTEKKTVAGILRDAGRNNAPDTIETDFMIWKRPPPELLKPAAP